LQKNHAIYFAGTAEETGYLICLFEIPKKMTCSNGQSVEMYDATYETMNVVKRIVWSIQQESRL